MYKGMCIGGPRDGEILVHSHPRLDVATCDIPPLSVEHATTPIEMSYQRHTYWHETIRVGNTIHGMWIEQYGGNAVLDDAISRMFRAYAIVARQRRNQIRRRQRVR